MDSLGKLKTSLSCGPDGIPSLVLKRLSMLLIAPLFIIFCFSIASGTVPDDWRLTNVRPLFKKGSRVVRSNYRPISLTCVMCKVLERIIRNYLLQYFLDNGLISNRQFGFLPRRSTILCLLKFIHSLVNARDDKVPMDTVFIDFRKAFDTVSHQNYFTNSNSMVFREIFIHGFNHFSLTENNVY